MAQRTTSDDTLTREELATYFEHLAEEFAGDDDVRVDVGNKTVQLSPPEAVDLSVDVVERSTMFRGDHETVEIELNWKP
ncbi:amphi-Trp domain-containing protein [Natrarchaeobius oligotrophus]|uniref:Amphi-Trp domain-containing protein n=1 Tax=Natrarchaeobius chitinivorans TaxID=1679083 RepID=A0A3N6MVZ3_NATCH|nr:amphi-Trp domain-containing protein [Natrarchaeobius chitinivorans]RQH00522.1 amphi-Trp domain-containing protein [Natrarchaeobius chitinivorans]